MHDESLPDVVIASYMQPPHGTSFVTVSKGSFQELTPTGQQTFAPIASNSSSIRVDGSLRLTFSVIFPIPPSRPVIF